MTEVYDWNPMPHKVAVSCPACEVEARFEFAERVKLNRKTDVPYFETSANFEYEKLMHGSTGLHHFAWYFHGSAVRPLALIENLPSDYSSNDWEHSQYLYRGRGTDRGTIICSSCDYRRKSSLQWPADAHYTIEYKNSILWAFNREMAVELLRFVESPDRNFSHYQFRSFLMKIPKLFLSAKSRSSVVKKLRKNLNLI